MTTTLGQRLFNAQTEMMAAEGAMERLLDAALGEDEWDEFTCDYYDASIEVYAPDCDEVEATAKLAAALAGQGVHGFYLHPHERKWCGMNREKCMRTTRRRAPLAKETP